MSGFHYVTVTGDAAGNVLTIIEMQDVVSARAEHRFGLSPAGGYGRGRVSRECRECRNARRRVGFSDELTAAQR